MRHLMRYEGFSSQERQDKILDKISKYGISSITDDERVFLDSFSLGKQEEVHKKMNLHETDVIFEDDSGLFKFEFKGIKNISNEKHIIGVIYVPDIVLNDGTTVEGRLEGKIIDYGTGQTSPDFYLTFKHKNHKITYDIFEFCNGIEYELDSFIDYVVSEVENSEYL